MRRNFIWSLTSKLGLVAMLGCGIDGEHLILDQRFSVKGLSRLDKYTWSEPVWLGPVVNSDGAEFGANLSNDGLSLYFNSNRGGGLGGLDIWVSRRAGPECPWETPMNLGLPLNTEENEGVPVFSLGENLMFFASHGHDAIGSSDIFVSHRADRNAEFEWEAPVNLGPDVNTMAHESSPAYLQSGAWGGQLYFTRDGQFYTVSVDRHGRTGGPAVLVPELSDPGGINRSLTVRADGRELIFFSNAPHPDALGRADLWVASRSNLNDFWSTPRNVGPPLNSEFPELEARLSLDGRTLLISMGPARGGLGFQDLWMSTRGPSVKGAAVTSTPCP